MTKHILTIFIFFMMASACFSQNAEFDKTIQKANKLVAQNRLKEADELVQGVLNDYPYFGEGWDYLAKLRFERYLRAEKKEKKEEEKKIVIQANNDDSKLEAAEIVKSHFNSIESSAKLSYKSYSKYVYTLRMGTMKSNDAYYCSQMLRSAFIDVDIDSTVKEEALKIYEQGEIEFEKHNYHDATLLYKKALDIQPDFYKAALYMGDCFYYMGNYKDAMSTFKEVIEKHPTALEPRKYLIDTFLKVHLFDKAIESSIASMLVYPDHSIAFDKFETALSYTDHKFGSRWTPRGVFPNSMEAIYHTADPNAYHPELEEFAREPWNYYRNAQTAIAFFCDANGIVVKPNELTKSKYMEVYSWELMLKSSKHPWLAEARRMQEDGFLDCYAMITCFHFDFYAQYKDFVENNSAKINQYFKKYILEKE